jgi:predicted AAA+ superfamily ATPase
MFERAYLQILKKRILEQRGFIQVVTGPRQVGKTTIVWQMKQQLPFESLFAAADDVPAADHSWIRNAWDEARLKLHNSGGNEFLLIIDEIQKIDNWSETVKKEWDADTLEGRNLKVIILGSSRLLIQKGLTESLAGRFEYIFVTHWTFSEMKEAFGWTIDQYIWFGGYPGSVKLIEDEPRWKAYIKDSLIETSISRDVLMLTRVDKPALLKRLFEIGCCYSSQIVSLNKVQGELQEKGNLTTLANYLRLLEGAGLLTGLEKYSGDIIRKRSSKPKFQVFNNALISAQSNLQFSKALSEKSLWGRLTESAVGVHLLNSSIDKRFNLSYWNENHNELDFVMEKNGKLIGIEVKSGIASPNRGMALFEETYHPEHLFIVGTGGIPIEQFLSTNPAQLFKV